MSSKLTVIYLGPVLFSVYIKDIVDLVRHYKILFADDIKMYSSVSTDLTFYKKILIA